MNSRRDTGFGTLDIGKRVYKESHTISGERLSTMDAENNTDVPPLSALYVVDLRVFRAIAAGDQLRQHYQALSADPNSLANLDQDLPNNMQSALPIVS